MNGFIFLFIYIICFKKLKNYIYNKYILVVYFDNRMLFFIYYYIFKKSNLLKKSIYGFIN